MNQDIKTVRIPHLDIEMSGVKFFKYCVAYSAANNIMGMFHCHLFHMKEKRLFHCFSQSFTLSRSH